MALVTRLKASQGQEASNDITKNLPSLQFESALTDEEKSFIHLRAKSHAISVSQCALATVMVDIFKQARDIKMHLKYPDRKKSTQILQDEEARDTLKIGIVGCGRLGSQIAHCLLTYGQIHPSKLHISTRRPETLEYLQHKGVECYFNNQRLISSVHVVFFCVLPSQMPVVSEEVKDYISSSIIAICPSSSLRPRRLKQMLGTSNIICPIFHWKEENLNPNYNHNLNVNTALENKETVLATCPIGVDKTVQVVSTDERLFETMMLAVVNMCVDEGLSPSQILTVLHCAVFGETHKKPLHCDRLTPEDFNVVNKKTKEIKFPFYDLVDVYENGTGLLKNLEEREGLIPTFVNRYCHLFEDYIHKRAYGQIP